MVWFPRHMEVTLNMKKLVLSAALFVVGIFVLVWFSNTDQGQAGAMLWSDVPNETNYAHGWQAFVGWIGIFALLGAAAALLAGVIEITDSKRRKQEQLKADKEDRENDRIHTKYQRSVVNCVAADPKDPKRPSGYGREGSYSPES